MKIAIITGASSGIGREFVTQIEHFYNRLDEIWVVARRKERLDVLSLKGKTAIRVFEGDMRKPEVYEHIKSSLETEKPDIRMLVNAAGFGKCGTVEDIARREPGAQAEMIDLNCRALTQMTLMCLPYCSKGSRILNIASAAAFCPQPFFAVYAATKSYVLSFSRGLGAELKKKYIYVTAVCPGPVDTEFFDVSGSFGSRIKDAVMVKAELVVKKALYDAKHKRTRSVCGAPMKGAAFAAKALPHGLILGLGTRGKL